MANNSSKRGPGGRHCSACDYQILKSMDDRSLVRELQDKIEQLHFKFLECRNQNQVLKRDLLVAKKVMCQEVGGSTIDFQNLLKHGTESGWKGRQEKVLLLKNKVQELQNRISEMEGDAPTPQETASEEFTKQKLPCDRKMYWRMELERRQVHQKAEKDINCLIEECNQLRRKLDSSKSRNLELSSEIHMLRGELRSLIEKCDKDTGIINTLHNVESQLKDTLLEKAELRRELDSARTRNKRLCEELAGLRLDVTRLENQKSSDQLFIDDLNHQHKQFQDMIEWEKIIALQNHGRYKEELKKLQSNHSKNSVILDQLQGIMAERDNLIQSLQDVVAKGFMASELEVEEGKESTTEQSVMSEESKPADSEAASTAEGGTTEGEAETPAPVDPQMQTLQLDCTKYRALFQAAQEESQRLADVAAAQNKRLEDLTMQVVETRSICMQKDVERKELQASLKRLQRLAAAKKRRSKVWDKSKKSESSQPSRPIEELQIRIDVQSEENEFLRNFLRDAMVGKEGDFELYKTIVDETKKLFITALHDLRKSLKEKKNDVPTSIPEEEVPAQGTA